MALRITPPPGVKIDQALHGYADGHRQLALSAAIKPADLKTLLVMSDSSGSGMRIAPSGYLTGYPLLESRVYALARTWPATELPRPGCVWTHTLLIDFENIASIEKISGLAALFKRPDAAPYVGYSTKLDLVATDDEPDLDSRDLVLAKALLAALYGYPTRRIVAQTRDSEQGDRVTLRIWEQQWPRLRRSTRFCTHAAADRSIDGNSFDLQLAPLASNATKPRVIDALDADHLEVIGQAWLDAALNDLAARGGGARLFMRSAGSDIAEGRAAFAPLVELHSILSGSDLPASTLDAAIDILDHKLSPSQARYARARVTMAGFTTPAAHSDAALSFVVRNIGLVDATTLSAYGSDFGRTLWDRAPELLQSLDRDDKAVQSVIASGASRASTEQVLSACSRVPDLLGLALRFKPQILTSAHFWKQTTRPPEVALTALGSMGPSALGDGIAALIASGRDDLSGPVISAIGAGPVLEAICAKSVDPFERSALKPWIQAATSDSNAVFQFLAAGKARSWNLLDLIAEVTRPDALPSMRNDPWLAAAQALISAHGPPQSPALLAFLLARAIGGHTLDLARLAMLALEPFIEAAVADRISRASWKLVEEKFGWEFSWLQRDRLVRLIDAVAELTFKVGLPPAEFNRAIISASVFQELIIRLETTGRGRRYLRDLAEHLASRADHQAIARHSAILAVLDRV